MCGFGGDDVSALPTARRHRVLAIGALALCIAALTSACAAGKNAQTSEETPAIDGNGARIGNVVLREVAIATPPNGLSYAAGDAAELRLVIVNNGPNPDTLTAVTSPLAGGVASYPSAAAAATTLGSSATASIGASSSSVGTSPTTTPSGAPTISGSGSASSASASATSAGTASSAASSSAGFSGIQVPGGGRVALGINDGDQVLVLTGLKQVLYPAAAVTITFTFQDAGSVTVQVPVQITRSPGPASVIPTLSTSEEVSEFSGE
jgi:copper(I)-binding protein